MARRLPLDVFRVRRYTGLVLRSPARPVALSALACLTIACGEPTPPPADGDTDAGSRADGDAGSPPPGPDVCDELDLPRAPFREGTGADFHDIAGDFTVETLDGPWSLSTHWSGCESYVFIVYAPNDYGNALLETYPDALFLEGPRNVQYFFASYETDRDAIRERMRALRATLEEGFDFYEVPAADREFWRARFHFVTEPIQNSTGSVGDLIRAQPYVQHTLAITREQRFDPLGSLFAFRSSGTGPDMGMAAWAGLYYDYLFDLHARLAGDGATVVTLIDETDVTARTLDRTVTLPNAATMERFDTMEVEVQVHCHLDPANCSEWDRIANVQLCLDEACTDTLEIARWITPYSRPGLTHWAWDASPFLALLRDGGQRTFRIVTGPDWEEPTPADVRVALRLSERGAPRAVGAALAFVGGPFDATYNASHEPFRFTPPADTTRVELVAIVSGHGMAPPHNCAEWCNHEHAFRVNDGGAHRIDFPEEAGEPLGCAHRAAEGVPPGQWGNWAHSRAGWCPGFPVHVRRFDLTSEVVVGSENTLSYEASFMGREPPGGENVAIVLSAYVVYYR